MDGQVRERRSSSRAIPSSQLPILVASNHLPILLEKDEEGKYVATWRGERLLTSTMAFSHQDLFRSSRRKIRFIGRVEIDVPIEEQPEVIEVCYALSCVPVFPSCPKDSIAFDKFCTNSLRSLFLNSIHPSTIDPHTSESFSWDSFLSVSKDFALGISRTYETDEVIWIQDYELTMVPHFLARHLRHAPTGLFFHVPFPSKNVLSTLSFKEDLLKSMLQVNHLGFHLYDHAKHFFDCCQKYLHLPPPSMLSGQMVLHNNGKRVSITCTQLTIDSTRVEKELASNHVRDEIIHWRQLYPHKIIFASCDVVDILHGIPQKFLALHEFLKKNPDFASRVLLVQIGIITGSLGSTTYAETIQSVADEINAQYDDPVILFQLRKERMVISERIALWRVAQVYISTVFSEGLNTCPFEYIITHRHATGLAILSQYAGASRLLHGATIINPWNVHEIATSMENAVHMSLKEKEFRRECDILAITSHTPSRWAATIISDIAAASYVSPKRLENMTKPLTDEFLIEMYRKSRGRRIFFFDYYRTLAPDASSEFGIVWPDVPVEVLSSLEQLCRDQRNTVFVVSGCNCELLSDKFGSVPGLGLVAEHGYFIRWAMLGNAARMEKPWELYGDVFRVNAACGKWREKAENIMQVYVDRTNGAAMEMRRSSILFRYAAADYSFGLLQAMELSTQLKSVFEGWPLSVIQGKDYIEVRPEGLGKGKIVKQILQKLHKESPKDEMAIDFVWTLGDDVADELMFDAVHCCGQDMAISHVLSCTVGHKTSKAQYYVSDHNQVVALLGSLRLELAKSSRYHSVADMQSMIAKHLHHIPQVSYNAALPLDSVTRKNSSKTLRHSGLAPVMEEEMAMRGIDLPELVFLPQKSKFSWLTGFALLILCGLSWRSREKWRAHLLRWKWWGGCGALAVGVAWKHFQRKSLQ